MMILKGKYLVCKYGACNMHPFLRIGIKYQKRKPLHIMIFFSLSNMVVGVIGSE